MSKGIYLVANKKSEELCANLIYSIRESGCKLPIRIIHFGGEAIRSSFILNEVELVYFQDFSKEAQDFVNNLRTVLTDCPMGFLYRFLAWYSDWDQFIYSDNDIVALCNWEKLFELVEGHDLLHCDTEYTTNGIFNYDKPEFIKAEFGSTALESALTAGHFLVSKNESMIEDINSAVRWYSKNPGMAKNHDQALLHIASLLGSWKMLNLCKAPNNWLSSWSGDFKHDLELIQLSQAGKKISHLHYSGGTPSGYSPVEELLLSNLSKKDRLKMYMKNSINHLSNFHYLSTKYKRLKKKLKNK